MDDSRLKKIAAQCRKTVLKIDYFSRAGHVGGSMSCMDILIALYHEVLDVQKIKNQAVDRDRFILSKGHCAEALYTVLSSKDFFPQQELETYAQFATRLAEHPTRKVPGIEAATGALGHGLSLGVGMALSLKRDKVPARVFVLMGDGEQAEGSNWEAAMAASKFGLNNLIAIVDRNRLQITGDTEEVMPLESLSQKYAAFGWEVKECNGHSFSELLQVFGTPMGEKPRVILAQTVKGKGVSYMENQAKWHHGVPNEEQYLQGMQELSQQEEVSRNG